ncbi:hypothetical protein BH23PSE1_BH23PSE1_01190 [soil metagenome]
MVEPLPSLIPVALGGALGGVARHLVSLLSARLWRADSSMGTLVVNVSDAAALGAFAAMAAGRGGSPPTLWLLAAVGGLGSYTTVSAFSMQALALLQAGKPRRALAYIAASLGLCLAAAGLAYGVAVRYGA